MFRHPAITGAALATAFGLLFCFGPLGDALAALSFSQAQRVGLTRLPAVWELGLFVVVGISAGAGLPCLPTKAAIVCAAVGVAILALFSWFLLFYQQVWWRWLVPAGCQIPLALAWSLWARARQRSSAEVALAGPSSAVSAKSPKPSAQAAKAPIPVIPGCQLLRRVGRGAYGEVWLGRDASGEFCATKIVFRHRFPNDAPYEREFKGLQNYAPFARLHPGWVQIKSMGRDDAARYFFCVMEAADDETTGRRIDIKTYVPKTLARMLRTRGRLPLSDCVELGLTLAAAVEHLHQHSLIHRDIKPSNVIFANGAPKFADIGLVTGMKAPGRDVSYLGTDGYMAPEGPGTPASDVYSLGKLLYEIGMGRDRREFPELPATLVEKVAEPAWSSFHEILFKACEIQPRQRYQSAAQLHADLLKLKSLLAVQK